MGGHWGARNKSKNHDANIIANAVFVHGTSKAGALGVKKLVTLYIVLAKGKRACDPDSQWKSLLDGLVKAGVLFNDSPQWCQISGPVYLRGPQNETFIVLEDLS